MITVEKLQEALDKHLTAFTDLFGTNVQLDDNICITSTEGNQTDWSDINDFDIESYQLDIDFYDCYYTLTIPKEAIDNNNSYRMSLSGDSKLHESLEDILEDELWAHIKIICAKYKELALKYEYGND